MELRTINTFLHIAELHSFSRAARELGYSQSAVSAQVAQLEADNAAVCPPMIYAGPQLNEIQIEGRAVGFCRGL